MSSANAMPKRVATTWSSPDPPWNARLAFMTASTCCRRFNTRPWRNTSLYVIETDGKRRQGSRKCGAMPNTRSKAKTWEAPGRRQLNPTRRASDGQCPEDRSESPYGPPTSTIIRERMPLLRQFQQVTGRPHPFLRGRDSRARSRRRCRKSPLPISFRRARARSTSPARSEPGQQPCRSRGPAVPACKRSA